MKRLAPILVSLMAPPATGTPDKTIRFVPTESTRHGTNGISLESYLSANVMSQSGIPVSATVGRELQRAFESVAHRSRSLVTLGYDASAERVTLAFDGAPGPDKEALVADVALVVERCFGLLESHEDRWSFVRAVDHGIVGSDPEAQAAVSAAAGASQKMFASFASDACASQGETPSDVTLSLERLKLSLRALLGVAGHPQFSGGSKFINLITAVTPLLFVERGVWVRVQQGEMRSVLEAALRQGFLSDAATGILENRRYETFLDAALAVRASGSETALLALKPFAELCSGAGIDAAFAPFDYKRCLAEKPVSEVKIEMGGKGWITLEGRQ